MIQNNFQGIEHRQTDWKTFLINKLVGAKTLPENFRQKVKEQNPNDHLDHCIDIQLDSTITSMSIQEKHDARSDR